MHRVKHLNKELNNLKKGESNKQLTAPDECFPHIKKFRKMHVPNTMPGYRVAVCNEK